jgi:hypothetical protein
VDVYIHSPIRLHGIVLNSLNTGTTLPLPSLVGIQVESIPIRIKRPILVLNKF